MGPLTHDTEKVLETATFFSALCDITSLLMDQLTRDLAQGIENTAQPVFGTR
jgi:hypothetical protein